jgi:hypothetical protein
MKGLFSDLYKKLNQFTVFSFPIGSSWSSGMRFLSITRGVCISCDHLWGVKGRMANYTPNQFFSAFSLRSRLDVF